MHFIGFRYLQPPPLPSNHVHRHSLLDEIVTKLLQATNDPNKYETTLTITGAGGFGKTNTVTSLCYHPLVKEQFTDGFVFIELGPQATDPNVKLAQLYHLLTGDNLKHSDINLIEQEIKQLANDYYRDLLVIIDDVWHVEDAEPLVKAFSSCKTILTTRMNDIDKYIPSIQSVIVGPMTNSEALSLLTNNVIECCQLSPQDVNLLNELAQDVHLWPLLLSLVRGQLFHYIKRYHLPYHRAILNVQAKLYDKGLTAFDKNNIEKMKKGRKLAVEACIEMTLELLTKSLSVKVKKFVLFNGIGMSLQTEVLHNLWNISKEEAEDVIDRLWAFGLVQFTNTAASPSLNTQRCLEVHAVISQYIIECMNAEEMKTLSSNDKEYHAVHVRLQLLFRESYGVHDLLSLTPKECLKYILSEIKSIRLPICIRLVNIHTVTDLYFLTTLLQSIQRELISLPCTLNIITILIEELDLLIAECKKASRNAHMLHRRLNQSVQRILYEGKYNKLIPAIQEFLWTNPLCSVAQKAIVNLKKLIPYCNAPLQHILNDFCGFLHLMTPDYHHINTATIPIIELHIKNLEQITGALMNGSPAIELTYRYFISDEYWEDEELLKANRLIKLQEVIPNFVHHKASNYRN